MNKNDRIFVAGHRGMVGSAIFQALVNEGFQQIITATRSEVDLTDERSVASFMDRELPEYIFLAAAKVGGIKANSSYPVEFLRENSMIQNNVIHHAYRIGAKKVLFLGSSCIYPRNCEQPIREEYLLTGPLEPTNEAYALAKIAGLKLVQYYHQEYGTRGVCAMPCNMYGPNDSFDLENCHVLSALVRRFADAVEEKRDVVILWGTGIARREFMHVDDCARALLLLMKEWESPEVINVGTGVDLTVRELAEMVAIEAGFQGRIEWDSTMPDGMLKKCLDISKISSLGFKPQISLQHGMKEVLSDYRNRKATGFLHKLEVDR